MDIREKLVELMKEVKYSVFPNSTDHYTFGVQLPYSDRILRQVADHLIAHSVTVQEWISVKDRLPDCADTVLAVDRDGIMSTAYYVGYWHGGGDLDEYAVTHWMPLPQPPKGE